MRILESCPICESKEWENLDHLRSHDYWYDRDLRYKDPVGFKICKECAFTTYDYIDSFSDMYETDRKAITSDNLITGSRKCQYHGQFLEGVVKKDWKVLDVGAAQGTFLNFLHDNFGVEKKNMRGTEFSSICRNFSKNYYDIELDSELPKEGKFDFISYYHVLEHCEHPNIELEKAMDLLTNEGLLYISVPTWYGALEEASGPVCADFENLFHVNHINVWSDQGFLNILNNAGLEVIKEEKRVYGYTVLCKNSKKKDIVKEDYQERIKTLENQKQAIALMNAKQYKEAIETYNNFPDAFVLWAMTQDMVKDINAQLELLGKGLDATGGHLKIWDNIAAIKLQWYEKSKSSNVLRDIEEMLNKSLKIKHSESVLFLLGILHGVHKNDSVKGADYLQQVININPSRFKECMNFICNFLSK